MPFSQNKHTNILKCDGCNERCDLTPVSNDALNANKRYKPAIAGTQIDSYTNQNGAKMYTADWTSYDIATEQARTICRLCDKYQLPHLAKPAKFARPDKVTTAIYLINQITQQPIDIRRTNNEKTMALLYLMWLEYQSLEQKYTQIPTDSPLNAIQWHAYEFGPADPDIYYAIDYINQQIHNKQIPTINAAGFDTPCDQARISAACANTFNNYAHAAPNEITLFVKYNLREWQKTWQDNKVFTPMFKITQNATALEIDQYLAQRAKFIQFTKKR